MTDELKPCPFCGNTDLMKIGTCVECKVSGAESPPFEEWNTRADLAAPRDHFEEGRNAYHDDKCADDNPYRSPAYTEWERGWHHEFNRTSTELAASREPSVAQAMQRIVKEMNNDPEYVWGWQSNIAGCAEDKGLSSSAANRAAAHFLRTLGVTADFEREDDQ